MACSDFESNKCFLCQTEDKGYLRQPTELGYKSLASDLIRWKHDIGSFRIPLKFEISNTESLVEWFIKNGVKWHKVCRVQFDEYKLNRHRSRKHKPNIHLETHQTKRPRSKSCDAKSTLFPPLCFLCNGKKKENLRTVSTKKLR